jgi:cytoskeletal protein RodZ
MDALDSLNVPVGSYLRELREAKGHTLDDVARVTRISKIYLIAIEEGKFEKLPSTAYIKGFLRLYASFLGVPGDNVIARYEQTVAPPQIQPLPTIADPIKSPEPVRLGHDRRRWFIPIVLLIMIVVVAFLFQEEKRTDGPAPQAVVTQQVPAPLPAVVQPEQPPAEPGAAVQQQAPLANGEPPGTRIELVQEGIVLRLKFLQDTWLGITIDDTISQRYELKAGDVIEWKAERSFTVDLGNAGAVEAEFNGKPLKPFGATGAATRIVLKKDM